MVSYLFTNPPCQQGLAPRNLVSDRVSVVSQMLSVHCMNEAILELCFSVNKTSTLFKFVFFWKSNNAKNLLTSLFFTGVTENKCLISYNVSLLCKIEMLITLHRLLKSLNKMKCIAQSAPHIKWPKNGSFCVWRFKFLPYSYVDIQLLSFSNK